ncbi:MAG: hypothetical protein IKD59_09240 [Lachnospiraceae bacterium]|nr:hypothetical protein [Lachnospiraceae bacterium]MBR3374224.1 hypothetical protein [Bacillota bacterium]
MIIAVDFDGVLCENRWPDIGRPNMKMITRLKELQSQGHKIILWTCRTDNDFKDYNRNDEVRHLLTEAVEWCKDFGLAFDYVNENSKENISIYKNDCRKVHANIYIDDQNASPEFMEKYNIPFVWGQTYMEKIL